MAAAAAGVYAGERALALIRSSGGFTVYPVSNQLAPFTTLPHNALEVLQGILVLFGADFPGRSVSFLAAVGLVHLIGVGLVIWAVCAAFRRFARAKITVQLLAAGVACSVIAYLLGPNAEAERYQQGVRRCPAARRGAGRPAAGPPGSAMRGWCRPWRPSWRSTWPAW